MRLKPVFKKVQDVQVNHQQAFIFYLKIKAAETQLIES
jgi:hypothetical protein